MLRKLRKKQGFTLVEIMIVVGIITMLAALSIHNLLRAKVTANEAATIKNLRTFQTAMYGYNAVNGRYPRLHEVLDKLCNENPPYLDISWYSKNDPYHVEKNGYRLELKYDDYSGQEFSVSASPVNPGVTGGRTFFLFQMSGRSPEIIDEFGNGLGATPN